MSCELEHSGFLAFVSFFWEYGEKAGRYHQAGTYCKEWIFNKSWLSWLGQLDNFWTARMLKCPSLVPQNRRIPSACGEGLIQLLLRHLWVSRAEQGQAGTCWFVRNKFCSPTLYSSWVYVFMCKNLIQCMH